MPNSEDLAGINEAEKRISEAERAGAMELDLSELGLRALPDALGNLTALTSLILGSNQLTALPESLGKLTALTTLYLSGNQLTALPDSLSNLTHLKEFGLSGQPQLRFPPADIAELGSEASLRYLRAAWAGSDTVW